MSCTQGGLCHFVPPPPLPVNGGANGPVIASTNGDTEKRFTAAEKAKGRPVDDGSDASDTDGEDAGRGKRVRKKRRLSATDEVDPNLLNLDGSLRKPRAKGPRIPGLPGPGAGANRPEDVRVTEDDARYRAAVEANDQRPDLSSMRGFCPVWANRRRELFAAAEYLRAPVPTAGASVDIGRSGVARGVILEGPSSPKTFWGEGGQAGSIAAYM